MRLCSAFVDAQQHVFCMCAQYLCFVRVKQNLPHGPHTDMHKTFIINYKTKTYHMTSAVISHTVYVR